MSTQIYQSPDFKVYKTGDGYIVHNRHKDFKYGHTHVKNYDICMVMIKLVEKKKMPKSHSRYFIESILRISDDRKYIKKIKQYAG